MRQRTSHPTSPYQELLVLQEPVPGVPEVQAAPARQGDPRRRRGVTKSLETIEYPQYHQYCARCCTQPPSLSSRVQFPVACATGMPSMRFGLGRLHPHCAVHVDVSLSYR